MGSFHVTGSKGLDSGSVGLVSGQGFTELLLDQERIDLRHGPGHLGLVLQFLWGCPLCSTRAPEALGEMVGHHVISEAVEIHPGLIFSPQGPQDQDVQEMAALPVLV